MFTRSRSLLKQFRKGPEDDTEENKGRLAGGKSPLMRGYSNIKLYKID